jgi:hypothetical protein
LPQLDASAPVCWYRQIRWGAVTDGTGPGRAGLAFGLALAGTLLVTLAQDPRPFHHDAAAYWELAATFTDDGGFSLLSFESPLRGYLLPLAALGLNALSEASGWGDVATVKIFNSLVFALTATVLAPKLAELTWPERRWGLWPRLALAAFLAVFWRGHLGVPLTDFPALALALVALIATAHARSPGWTFVAGVAAAATINLRPAYLLLPLLVAALLARSWFVGRAAPRLSWRRRALVAGLFVAGFALVSLPQSVSTHRHYEAWSFVPGAVASLSSFQLTAGLEMQRYDTLVGSDGTAPPRLVYDEPAGTELLAREGGIVSGYGDYLGIALENPVEVSGVLVRHVINGLDHRHDGPYVETYAPDANRPVRLAGFLLVFLAAARLAWPTARRALGPARWRYLAALLLCALPAVISAVETRFMLPAFLTCCIVVLTPGWSSPAVRASLRRRRVLVPSVLFATCALSLAAALHVTDQAVDHLRLENSHGDTVGGSEAASRVRP